MLISIVLATYNGEKYLREQIQSILSQTYTNIEVIIQDDGSVDGTLEILTEFAASDSRLSYSVNKKNLGLIDNFYDLIQKANGELIAISDQDDIWLPEKIETLASEIGDSCLIYSDSSLIDAEGHYLGKTLLGVLKLTPAEGCNIIGYFEKNTVSGHACLFKRSLLPIISKYQRKRPGGDFMYDKMIATLASFYGGVKFYSKPLTQHRIHQSNNHNSEVANDRGSGKKYKNKVSVSFFQTRINRVKAKIDALEEEILLFDQILQQLIYDLGGVKISIIPEGKTARSYLQTTFINIKLYKQLRNHLSITRKDAFHLSKGFIYLYLFKVF